MRALGVEVSAKEKWRCIHALLRLYSRALKDTEFYPNGFVKLKKDAINMKEKSKMHKLRHRQKSFLESIVSYTTYDILQLNYSNNAGQEPTLQQMIMELKTADGCTNLFHSVDMD